MADPLPPDYVGRVLAAVALIPAGKVLSYGDVAELVEVGGPRSVGRVLSRHGAGCPWWRVVRVSGEPAPAVLERAMAHYQREGTPLRGERVDMRRARWAGPGSVGGP